MDIIKKHGAPMVFCGAEMKSLALASRSPWIADVTQFALLLDYVRGSVVSRRPFSARFLAERAGLVEKLTNPLQLAEINKQLKNKGMKAALDLYFAADRVENLALCVNFDCSLLRPFLLSLQEVDADTSLVRKTAILASIQDEALRWIHEAFDRETNSSSGDTPSQVHIVNTNLSAVERLVVCDQVGRKKGRKKKVAEKIEKKKTRVGGIFCNRFFWLINLMLLLNRRFLLAWARTKRGDEVGRLQNCLMKEVLHGRVLKPFWQLTLRRLDL